MKVELRDPNKIMKLSRLGSFHQSKLSFLRSFLNEFKDWEYKRDCLLYTSPSPRDKRQSRMPSSA